MCRGMSGKQLGCGAVHVSVEAGWSLGIRCGEENILTADQSVETAERIARERERYVYEKRDLAPCRRVVTVDPQGRVIAPQPAPQIALPDSRGLGTVISTPAVAPSWPPCARRSAHRARLSARPEARPALPPPRP